MFNVSKQPLDMKALDAMKAMGGKNAFAMMAMDAATAGGMAFLIGQLEKQDPKLREPLTSVTWMRDIVSKTGGGWVENTSTYNVSYAVSGPNENGIIGGQTNNIPVMQADIGKDIYKVFTFAEVLKVPYVDQAKLQGIGRSLEQILDNGIKLDYNKALDKNVYTGFSSLKTYGLVNNPSITAGSVATGVSGFTAWNKKTPDEILNDVNQQITAGWAAGEYDNTAIANHILIPPAQYTYLVNTKVSSAGNMSILEYLLANNIAKNQGIDLIIAPSRWCIGAGSGNTDRMVSYVNDEDKVYFDITVPLQRIMTQPNVGTLSYDTAYAAQMGEVKFLYLQPPRYGDGI